MAYSKANLKRGGDKASPSFGPFWIGKTISQMFTYMDLTVRFV
jgi:hypothetical protein